MKDKWGQVHFPLRSRTRIAFDRKMYLTPFICGFTAVVIVFGAVAADTAPEEQPPAKPAPKAPPPPQPEPKPPPPPKSNTPPPAATAGFSASADGGDGAYGASSGGSEDSVLRVLAADKALDLPVEIDRARFNAELAWHPDAHAFSYARIPEGGVGPRRYANIRLY